MVSERVQVEIAGMTFHVIGEDDAEYVKNLADEANRRIDEVERNNYRLNDVQLYILSLLNALDDMHKLETSEKEASELVGDTEAMKEKLREIDELSKTLKDKEKALEKSSARLEELQSSLKEREDAGRKLEKELADLKKAGESSEAELAKKDETIRELEEKNYETQMRLVDLNKEIYVLRGDDEEK
ncbi:MAG: cell division protein ZapA [Peptoniphilus sp.]|nr:cell division protein ZapA [Peptoniphilus sp.]MDD7362526.1 cell division protein ZapA [Bacillota bacterium]MDY6045075.1 cell division protein ZapA [Peptoniphilus sp.]